MNKLKKLAEASLRGRRRIVLAWIGLLVVTAVLLQWVDPAVFESPYAGF
jgi:hypothetical protein